MMGSRGVTRPMAEMKYHSDDDGAPDNGSEGHDMMSDDDRRSMLKMHHQQTLWIYWTLPLLGLWLLAAPFNFGYLNESLWVDPSGGRGPWFAEQPSAELSLLRARLMTISDLVCGFLLVLFGWRSLTPNRPVSLWTCCFVGVWLTFAPVLFWAPTVASYVNDSIVGMLVMALTILIPGMPNMIMYMQHGPATPPGWTYNPSSWPQRWIMIVTGFVGFVVSRYLAMFQLGYITYVWDPFFGFQAGTEKVLNSDMSHSLPISDGALGAIAYTFEFMMGYMGSPARWRTMPWMVAFFGFLVVPLGLVHVLLVGSQGVVVHEWCTMCLLAGIVMLPMIPLEVDEVVAMFQHLRQAKQRGDHGGSLWQIFWKGGKADGCTDADESPEMISLPSQPWQLFRSSIWGMSFPWTLAVCTAAGVLLMFCPTWFGIDIKTTAADIGHLGALLIVTTSVVCMGEVIRTGRYLNVLLGLAVAIGPWLVDNSTTSYAITCTLIGTGVVALSIPRGRITQSYGAWDAYIK